MARRSIYSRRQAQAPGTYETPLADFLDALPGYVNQYQQNKLQLDRQALQEKRYNDSQKIAEEQRRENKTQRELTNELNLLRLIPDYARAKTMSMSKIDEVSAIGDSLEAENKAFNDRINPLTGTDSDNIKTYKNMLNDDSIINNPTRKKQVESKIKDLTNKSLLTTIEQYYTDNPNDPLKDVNLTMAKYDPEQALKNINKQEYNKLTGDRKTLKGRDGVYYYEDTKEIVFPNLKTKIPAGQSVKSLTALFDAERSNLAFNKNEMNEGQINDSKLRLEKYRQQLEDLLKVEPNLYDPFKNTADPAKSESTKFVPGFEFK